MCYYANFAALFGETWGVWGLFGPSRFKLAIIGLLSAMQASFYMTLLVYLFPVASTCTVVPLIPAVFWDKVTLAGCTGLVISVA